MQLNGSIQVRLGAGNLSYRKPRGGPSASPTIPRNEWAGKLWPFRALPRTATRTHLIACIRASLTLLPPARFLFSTVRGGLLVYPPRLLVYLYFLSLTCPCPPMPVGSASMFSIQHWAWNTLQSLRRLPY